MDIDNERLAALVYGELHKTFVLKGRWRGCSDAMQGLWEEAVHEALVRAASQEGDEGATAAHLLRRLSTPEGERGPDCYTVAALAYEELIQHYESGGSFFGLGLPWEARTEKTHQAWAGAIRLALSRTALSGENPGGAGYCLHVARASADRPFEEAASAPPAGSGMEKPPATRRLWWKFW
ncbi:MAG: hypothetical protein U0736_03790 [Gemmataceae bacterium]